MVFFSSIILTRDWGIHEAPSFSIHLFVKMMLLKFSVRPLLKDFTFAVTQQDCFVMGRQAGRL